MPESTDGNLEKSKTGKFQRIKDIMICMMASLFLFFGSWENAHATSIGFGQTLSGSIDVAGEIDPYTFSANAGDIVTVVMATTSGNLWPGISIHGPDESKLCWNEGPRSAEISSCTLPINGSYIVSGS